jgi:hypothetical protein
MPSWPSSLPAPSMNGFSFQPVSAVSSTNMESGPKRVRQIFSQTVTECSVSWIFKTDEQLATFESFFQNELFSGKAWFDSPFRNGKGQTIVSARFSDGVFSARMVSGSWEVSAKLEIRNRPVD